MASALPARTHDSAGSKCSGQIVVTLISVQLDTSASTFSSRTGKAIALWYSCMAFYQRSVSANDRPLEGERRVRWNMPTPRIVYIRCGVCSVQRIAVEVLSKTHIERLSDYICLRSLANTRLSNCLGGASEKMLECGNADRMRRCIVAEWQESLLPSYYSSE